jgi:hypothetical protein
VTTKHHAKFSRLTRRTTLDAIEGVVSTLLGLAVPCSITLMDGAH